MIISHKYKYIYFKPHKVASSAVLHSLSKHCGHDDIVTEMSIEGEKFDSYSKNNMLINLLPEDALQTVGEWPAGREQHLQNTCIDTHITPAEIEDTISPEIWNNYYKFTIVRNPWDRFVSIFWSIVGGPEIWFKYMPEKPQLQDKHWRQMWKQILFQQGVGNGVYQVPYKYVSQISADDIRSFGGYPERATFISNLKDSTCMVTVQNPENQILEEVHCNRRCNNERYYFYDDGRPMLDFYMRYESIDKDYDFVCNRLGIPSEPLIKLNTLRRKDRNYREYYDEEFRNFVELIAERTIKHFEYKF